MATHASIEDLRKSARRRLPKFVFDFVDGGAGDEVTMRRNIEAFADLVLRPNQLVDVSKRSTSTVVLGEQVSLPILLAPTGLQRLVHRRGELEAAAGAGDAGTIYTVSTASGFSLEQIADAANGPLWFQLYLWRDRAVVSNLVERAQRAGYTTLVLTVDVPQVAVRDRDIRNGMSVPPRITAQNIFQGAVHPRWTREFLTGPGITFKNIEGLVTGDANKGMALMAYANSELTNPGATWDEVDWLRGIWPGKLVVKGVLTDVDALRAVDHGADGVIVSNHGGRQLDGSAATMHALPEVVAAVGASVEVLLDGGVRRGVDVIKAIALGAKAVMIGRPYWWGLSLAGRAGVTNVLEILRRELDIALALTGRPTIESIDRSVLELIAD